jgi:glycerol uptake facilitator-like aquaporin
LGTVAPGSLINPLMTLVVWFEWGQETHKPARVAAIMIAFQFLGAIVGAWLAHSMLDMTLVQTNSKIRSDQ